jgi:hypothetical protein
VLRAALISLALPPSSSVRIGATWPDLAAGTVVINRR